MIWSGRPRLRPMRICPRRRTGRLRHRQPAGASLVPPCSLLRLLCLAGRKTLRQLVRSPFLSCPYLRVSSPLCLAPTLHPCTCCNPQFSSALTRPCSHSRILRLRIPSPLPLQWSRGALGFRLSLPSLTCLRAALQCPLRLRPASVRGILGDMAIAAAT